ncbi:hypothetical protein SEA_WEASELS2_16 [Rhodococcus phage Weasels2]|uniref:Uncharacterized protein n=1 Tax=Rhodococcus phage Weasels2 TaxID=1897437 RepID=A0A1I9SA00_9CAUD|nr:hypothetical protein FDH04_gp016 [Rhodococcus phage Weasels2]AOZ63606.1 hypothetical protein SEA_WEASELS2_16 [Rhodococcus phage Weasels2]
MKDTFEIEPRLTLEFFGNEIDHLHALLLRAKHDEEVNGIYTHLVLLDDLLQVTEKAAGYASL